MTMNLIGGKSVHIAGILSNWQHDSDLNIFEVPVQLPVPKEARYLRLADVDISGLPAAAVSSTYLLMLTGVRPSQLNDWLLPVVYRFGSKVQQGPVVQLYHEIAPMSRFKFQLVHIGKEVIKYDLTTIKLYFRMDYFI